MSLDIAVEEPEVGKRRNSLPMALFGGAVLLGVGVALVLALRSPTPRPVDLPPPPVPAPSTATGPATPSEPDIAEEDPAAAEPITPEDLPTPPEDSAQVAKGPSGLVRFLITSEPSGARVTYAGKSLGTTPTKLEVRAGSSGRARAELTFDLGGYSRATVVAEGKGPDVPISKTLKKKGSRPPKPPGSNGYKDDPYQ
jgi:serine/threonine-protein kinase